MDLASCKQGGLEVVEFYSKLMGMWSVLENHVKISKCTCGKRECGIINKVAKMTNEEKIHQFFMGLNDQTFSTIHSQVLALDPLPSIDVILNMISKENHKKVMLAQDHRSKNMVAFAAREQVGEKSSCKRSLFGGMGGAHVLMK